MLIKPLKKLLNDLIQKESLEYIGEVEDNTDADKLGRIKVRIPLYEDIPTDDLPYCYPDLPSFLGGSKDSGMIAIPEIGSTVKVKFFSKDKYIPFYTSAGIDKNNKVTLFDEDYPNSYGFKDSIGNFFKINKTKKQIRLQHSSTSNIYLDENGSVDISTPNGSNITVENNDNYIEIKNEGKDNYIKIDGNNNVILKNILGEEVVLSDTGTLKLKSLGTIQIESPVLRIIGNTSSGGGISTAKPFLDGSVGVFSNGVLTDIIED